MIDSNSSFYEVESHVSNANQGHAERSLPPLEISGEAVGLSDAMNSYHERPADLVVSDISLKDGSGLELTRELFAMNSDVNILISSDYDDVLYADRALRAGAKGYLRNLD